jgi:hypothetical protein
MRSATVHFVQRACHSFRFSLGTLLSMLLQHRNMAQFPRLPQHGQSDLFVHPHLPSIRIHGPAAFLPERRREIPCARTAA